ncbi:MAG: indolepyruvate ferredoxin oxidoreductase subunit alpha [Patescibacteria group bacterium]|nr:indolepyruvate ferredoxin oxidoreductase subunit alpha [Patescibacteria group bacterium]
MNDSQKTILMGNEAIVKGAMAAGVQFVACYPGTPSSEIGILFSQIATNNDRLYFEFSTNEKLAMEAVVGASFSGLRCLAAMKSFGVNVALDSLLPFVYTGSKGPAVIVVADDPSCHSSAQSEENSRGFGQLAHIPILEPSNAQECFDFTCLAFEISEKFNIPVMVRITTRVAHQRGIVEFKVQSSKYKVSEGEFVKDKNRFVTMPPRVLEMHQELLDKIGKIREFATQSEINKIYREDPSVNSNAGIITSGVSFLHTMEALEMAGLDIPVLKLGFFYPLPEQKIRDFIRPLEKVLIVEELDPYLEKEVAAIAKDENCRLKIFGKNILPEVGELNPALIAKAAAELAGVSGYEAPEPPELSSVKHVARFCTVPACPYWRVFAAVKKAIPENKAVFGGDIGCYMLGAGPPHNLYDFLFSMGSGIGIAHGISKAAGGRQKPVAFIGDGTFFHAGLPALLNAVYNKSNILLVILDNRITAMTGHQPNPGMGKTGEGESSPEVKIENIVLALGVKPENMKVVDPVDDFEGTVKALQEFYQKNEVSVIVARRICALLEKRAKR